jgi:hypothetical protein
VFRPSVFILAERIEDTAQLTPAVPSIVASINYYLQIGISDFSH